MNAGRSLSERDRRCVWHPYTQHATESAPLEIASARGAKLVLADGSELIDAISSWWTCLHGHGHPRIVDAIARQAAELDHVLFAGATHEPAVRLAEELVAIAPRGLTRVFYSDDGSTAVEVALKMAYQHHLLRGDRERRVFVALDGSYHGDTFGAMSLGDPDPFFAPFAPLLFQVERVPVDAAAVEAALERLGERAAGVVVEPLVQGAGGMRMHDAAFLRAVRAAATRWGVPLIADEVMTGFGRTGATFACERAGIEPDLMCIAKGLTGGAMPLAATLAREELFESFCSADRSKAFFHGHSFTAHPIGCAAALASLSVLREEKTPERLDSIGAALESRLTRDLPAEVGRPRRTGGIVAFDCNDGHSGGYLSELAPTLRRAALDLGVLLRPLGDVCYAMPPACLDEAEIAAIGDALVAQAETAVLLRKRTT